MRVASRTWGSASTKDAIEGDGRTGHGDVVFRCSRSRLMTVQTSGMSMNREPDTGVFFQPWIGARYFGEGLRGRRVLVLGEAHYGQLEEAPEFTRDCVRNLALVPRGHRFFTVVAKLLLDLPVGPSLSFKGKCGLWSRITFANYIQCFPGTSARIRPTHVMWEDAAPRFLSLLATVQCDRVLVLGRELGGQLALPSGLVHCEIPHPSSYGFQLDAWRRRVREFLA